MVQARISGMISTDICQDCNSADIRLDSFILGNIADSGMITFGCVAGKEMMGGPKDKWRAKRAENWDTPPFWHSYNALK